MQSGQGKPTVKNRYHQHYLDNAVFKGFASSIRALLFNLKGPSILNNVVD